jgi:hypothetical protein
MLWFIAMFKAQIRGYGLGYYLMLIYKATFQTNF